MKVTARGQVTIPRAIREQTGLLPSTEVEWVVQGNEVILRKATPERSRGKVLVETLRGKATTGMSTDKIMALTRGND